MAGAIVESEQNEGVTITLCRIIFRRFAHDPGHLLDRFTTSSCLCVCLRILGEGNYMKRVKTLSFVNFV